MAESSYPLPAFHFSVEWGGKNVGFTEVTGLTIETQVIEYRDGAMNQMGPLKMPGIPKFPNITMKRGIIQGDDDVFEWLNCTSLNKVDRRDVTINLLNEKHVRVMSWVATNAWPVKVEGPGLKAAGNEVAIESIELAHDGLRISLG